MQVNRNITYTATEVRMEDLRDIVAENADVPDGALIRIKVQGGDRPMERPLITLEIVR